MIWLRPHTISMAVRTKSHPMLAMKKNNRSKRVSFRVGGSPDYFDSELVQHQDNGNPQQSSCDK